MYWLYFCILYNKNGIKEFWGHKGLPSLGLGPAWVLQWTLHWLYFCILCKKNGIKGLLGQKGLSSLGLGPTLVLQWTLPWPYNTPDMALVYIGYIFSFYATKMGSRDSGEAKVGPHWVQDPPWSFNKP